jgi:response regulator RpfG family c-di-GMP phosphodiesterase
MNILIVDDESAIREIMELCIDLESDATVIHAANGQEAIDIISDKKTNISLIICDYNMPVKTGGDVFTYLIDNKINIPYVMCSSDRPKDHKEFEQGEIFGHIEKPNISGGISLILERLDASQDNSLIIKQHFLWVGTSVLKNLKTCPCDVYLKLTDTKVVKIYKTGDAFLDEDVEKYKKKGFEKLLVEAGEIKGFIGNVEKSLIALYAKKEKITLDDLVEGQEMISSAINSFGMRPEIICMVQKNIEVAFKSFKEDPELESAFAKIFEDPNSYLSIHTMATAQLSCAIASRMSWNSDITLHKLTLASMLMDMSLHEVKITDYDEIIDLNTRKEAVDKRKWDLYKGHPFESANFVRKFKSIPGDVDKLIHEHHEHPDGSGFPRGISFQHISSLGAILIIASSIADHLYLKKDDIDNLSNKVVYDFLIDGNFNKGQFKKIIETIKDMKIFPR